MKPLFFLTLFIPSLLFAQTGEERYQALLLRRANTLDFYHRTILITEPSTLSGAGITEWNTSGKKSYVLHADVQMPIAIGGKRYSVGSKKTHNRYWMSSVHVVPQFKVRIFRDDPAWGDSSLPVRTPSYLPRLTYYGAPAGLWNREKGRFHFLGISAYHHSNGQDGTEFLGDSVNIYNGNFGENAVFNFLIGGIYQKGGISTTLMKRDSILLNKAKNDPITEHKTIHHANSIARTMYWRAGFEWHPVVLSNAEYHQTGVYGGNRIQLQAGWIISPTYQEKIWHNDQWEEVGSPKQKELFRIVVNMEYITDRSYYKGTLNNLTEIKLSDLSKRMNLNATGYVRIPGTAHAAGFLSVGYWGSDDYNVYFQKSMFQIRGGLAFAFFDYPRDDRDQLPRR
jgi:hypothetical protein